MLIGKRNFLVVTKSLQRIVAHRTSSSINKTALCKLMSNANLIVRVSYLHLQWNWLILNDAMQFLPQSMRQFVVFTIFYTLFFCRNYSRRTFFDAFNANYKMNYSFMTKSVSFVHVFGWSYIAYNWSNRILYSGIVFFWE